MPQPEATPLVSNSVFLQTLAREAPKGSSLWVTAFGGSPDLTDAKNWHGTPYSVATMPARVDAWTAQNTYFSVAALVPAGDGELRRRKANFARLLALVADDVQLEDIQGSVSYVLTTSPGKSQVGILIDGRDEDAANLQLVGRLVTTMADKGMLRADASGNNAVRYVRLPVGQNQKPRESGAWQHRMERWSPNVVLSLVDAAAAFGVDLDALRAVPDAAPAGATSVIPQDDRLRVLAGNVLRGENLHDSLNQVAASLAATAMPGGAIVNLLRAMMEASHAAKDERWQARYQDIPRSVSTAQEKFSRPIKPDALGYAVDEDEAKAQANSLPIVWAEEIDAVKIQLSELVEDVLTQGGLSVMYGESNSGKSFLACDLACVIATGGTWHGKRTVKGAVLYVAGEGAQSIKLRSLAWIQEHGEHPAMGIVPVAVNLLDPLADVDRIVAACKEVETRYSMPVVLIIVDTLARAFGGGNENSSEDMGAVILHGDAVRNRTQAALMFVHHSGKDQSKGSRGHSSLKAATDTEIEVTGEEETKLHTAHVTKQRDLGSRGMCIVTKFRGVVMGTNQWGKPITTCVVESTDEKPSNLQPASNKAKAENLTAALKTTLARQPRCQMLRKDLVPLLVEEGFTKSRVYDAIDRLVGAGEVTFLGGFVHLNGGDRA